MLSATLCRAAGCFRWIFAAWLLMGLLIGPVRAQSHAASDSTAADSSKQSVLVLPNVFYTPETKIAGGLVFGYFTMLDAQSPTSSMQVAAIYTQRKQFYVQGMPELYWHEGRWRLNGAVMFSRYPEVYYGIGPSVPAAWEEEYTSRLADVDLQLQRTLRPGWRVGPQLVVRAENVTEVADGGRLDTRLVPGRSGGTTVGLGLTSAWDTRDNLYFPHRGHYVVMGGLLHTGVLGSDFAFGRLTVDARRYVPVRGRHVLALNGYVEAVAGTAPFPLLPLLGGDDLMRGYREGRYRDTVLAALQAGYRFPLFNRLPLLRRIKGAVFGNVGNVARRVDALSLTGIKYAIGAGLRLRLNDEGIHGRVDYAFGPEGGALYVTLLEAF